MDELKLDDVFHMVGELYVQNYRMSHQLPKLQEEVTRLTAEIKGLHDRVQAKVVTVESNPSPETVVEAA